MTDLVERLRRAVEQCGREWWFFPLIAEAATALEAKDKELAALRERVKGLEQERNVQMLRALNATARAETAECERDHFKSKAHEYFGWYDEALRERDEAREVLKQCADALSSCYQVCDWPANGETTQDRALEAARAITGEKA